MTEDETVNELTKVFKVGARLARARGVPQMQLEMEALDMFMDYFLILGGDGVADVLTILALEETAPITREQVSFALGCYFKAEHLCDSKDWA